MLIEKKWKRKIGVALHGMWGSPYVKRVELGLKVKGIPISIWKKI